MAAPLKIGIAGLGTVGVSVIGLIDRQRAALASCCGRSIEVIAVNARSRGKRRAVDIRRFRWHSDPVALATDSEIDVFVELIAGEDYPPKTALSAARQPRTSFV